MNTSSKWLLTFVLLAAPVAAIAVPTVAPEIDPASTMSGLTLLAGCLVVLRGRKSRK
jgi:hypothetical protein